MHELSVTKRIFQIVMEHALRGGANRVVSVNLEIGVLSDLQEEWLQRYFDHLSAGSIAEGARVNVEKVPALFFCDDCRSAFELDSVPPEALHCVHCQSSEVSLISGGEYRVKNIEVL